MNKYLSILTNFGCHFTCPYCIVRKNGIDIPKTTVQSLDGLERAIKDTGCNIISVSGGGDPLHNYQAHRDFYDRLFFLCKEHNLPIEMHTSYKNSAFPYHKCVRVVYHLQKFDDLWHIKRRGNEIVRVVFVVTEDFTESDLGRISMFVRQSTDIDELSFRQMVDENYETKFHLHDLLRVGHHEGWWYYIQQGDYNTYFVNGRLTTSYQSLKEKPNV